jgi:hypothetical protein
VANMTLDPTPDQVFFGDLGNYLGLVQKLGYASRIKQIR